MQQAQILVVIKVIVSIFAQISNGLQIYTIWGKGLRPFWTATWQYTLRIIKNVIIP